MITPVDARRVKLEKDAILERDLRLEPSDFEIAVSEEIRELRSVHFFFWDCERPEVVCGMWWTTISIYSGSRHRMLEEMEIRKK